MQDAILYENDSRVEALDEILDVLSVVQPQLYLCITPIRRSTLHPTATRLLNAQPTLTSLRVRRDDLHLLLMSLLASQLRTASIGTIDENDCMMRCTRTADWMVQSFVPDDKGFVSWENFDTVLEHIMVCLRPFAGILVILISMKALSLENTDGAFPRVCLSREPQGQSVTHPCGIT